MEEGGQYEQSLDSLAFEQSHLRIKDFLPEVFTKGALE